MQPNNFPYVTTRSFTSSNKLFSDNIQVNKDVTIKINDAIINQVRSIITNAKFEHVAEKDDLLIFRISDTEGNKALVVFTEEEMHLFALEKTYLARVPNRAFTIESIHAIEHSAIPVEIFNKKAIIRKLIISRNFNVYSLFKAGYTNEIFNFGSPFPDNGYEDSLFMYNGTSYFKLLHVYQKRLY